MQKYQSTTPDWLYQTPALDDNVLSVIQKELIELSIHTKDNMLVPYTSTFVAYGMLPLERKNVFDVCPTLIQELQRLELLDNFLNVCFISVDANKEFPPHIDTDDVGLNIPLYNCDNTYTVWYDAKILDQPVPDDYVIGTEDAKLARIVDEKNAVEIVRVEANRPLWINTNVAHRPETHHDKLRMAASIRFDPAPINEKGELWPHLVK
jgi:hypothetical protein